MPDDLNVPDLPVELRHVWDYFLSMCRKRTAGAVCANPLTDGEILAWQARNRIVLDPFESECIDALDTAYLAAHMPKTTPQKK